MKRLIGVVFGASLLFGLWWVWSWRNQPLPTPAVVLTRSSFSDNVTTNGKIEALEWASARSEQQGLVIAVPISKGQSVAKGAILAQLEAKDAQSDLRAAEARIEEAKAQLSVLQSGGSKRETVEIAEALKLRQQERAQAEKELGIAERLAAKNAGTKEEVRLARDRLENLELQIRSLEAKKPVLVGVAELTRAEARLKEAEIAAEDAKRKLAQALIRSPLQGIAYQVDARLGSYLSPGDVVAQIGKTDILKVIVYVDEPELGRVRKGLPVTITWDALPNQNWKGVVEKTPTQIVPLGTRQVGEVECRIENSANELLPGTNVNVLIETARIENALLLPKEALRNVGGEEGVFLINQGVLQFRKVKLGARNVSRVVVLDGLREGDQVSVSTEPNLQSGMSVVVRQP